MTHKFFTLAEANRTLPLVKRVVTDIMSVYPQWKDFVAQYELISAKARPEWGESPEQVALKGIRRPAAPARSPEPHVKGLWLFVHVMGFTAWLGGGLAVMLSGITAKYFPPEQRLAVYRIMSVVSRNLIGPGAVLVVVSGFVLSVPYFKSATVPTWLLAMQGLGVLGAIVAIGIVTPTAARLGRLELDPRGELPESFSGLRRRQAIFATVAGVLALLALLSATLFR